MLNLKDSQLKRRTLVVLTIVALVAIRCTNEPTQFTEIPANKSGIIFRNDLSETQHTNILTYEYSYNGAGVAVGDVNNDGLADIYFSGNVVSNKLYLNKSDWKFDDVTTPSGTAGRSDWKTGVTMADVNGDGWLDIYVCYSGNAPGEGYNLPVVREYPNRSNQLFINQGCEKGGVPKFIDEAKSYGLDATGTFSTQAYFFDYDLDNDLDMLLVNHANMFYSAFFNTRRLRNLRHPYFGNRLYRNDSQLDSLQEGKPRIAFTNVSLESGIHGSGLNFGLSASISDLNQDGWPDFYVTNDYEEQDFCYINNRNGTFREESHAMFEHLSKFGMGSDIADINNDGMQDLLVLDMLPEDNKRQKLLKGPDEYDRYRIAVDSGYHHQYMRNTLQVNRGFAVDSLPRFSEVAQLSGLGNTDWSWSPFIVDLDNDGWNDIFLTNGYLRDFTNLDFMKYTSTVYNEAKASNKPIDYLSVIQKLPQTEMRNYAFRNMDGLKFSNVSDAWGLSRRSVSNGAAYADFDNDGDYDIIANCLNDVPMLLKNNADQKSKYNHIRIKLQGSSLNTLGVGATIRVLADSLSIYREAYHARGYASSVDPILTIGLGNARVIDTIEVVWPGGERSVVTNVDVNHLIVIDQKTARKSNLSKVAFVTPALKDVTNSSGIDFEHSENGYIDFKSQRLLFYQLSRLGGTLATGDVNGDGDDDVFFGGAAGQSGNLFLGKDDGSFVKNADQPWDADKMAEDTDAYFFDADHDGDLDLYVVSGGNEFALGDKLYQDRLYINEGAGKFVKAPSALPDETTSGSCVTAADYDHDGDLDLFVAGRHTPGNYSLIPRSAILENQSKNGHVSFIDVTLKVCRDLTAVGMVTSAIWTDYNQDSWSDLIVVGEWMPIRIFENRKGKLVERTGIPDLAKSHGWWMSLVPADVDGDGDEDYLLGNAGQNIQFKASEQQPITLYAGDFNQDGAIDPIVCYYIMNKSYPLATRDELLDQMGNLRKKFTTYEAYSSATIGDIISSEQLAKASQYQAYTLESAWMENIDHGNSFKRHTLPALAQISCTNGFLVDDFGGMSKEILLAGNFYSYKPQLGKSDASFGLLLKYADKTLKVSRGTLSNVWLTGDIRDMAILNFRNGAKRIVVSRNNDRPSVFEYQSRNQKTLPAK